MAQDENAAGGRHGGRLGPTDLDPADPPTFRVPGKEPVSGEEPRVAAEDDRASDGDLAGAGEVADGLGEAGDGAGVNGDEPAAVPEVGPTDPALVPPAPVNPALPAPARALTIGAVTKALGTEFPDISISKIRYLEDQKLLNPERTRGGYRLYSADDVARLRTILRLQRDEFLPLRVIRQELAAGRTEADIAKASPRREDVAGGDGAAAGRGGGVSSLMRRTSFSIRDTGAQFPLEDVLADTGAERRLVAELEEFGIVQGQGRNGTRFYDETEREIIRAVAELARYGVAGRNLRVFKSSADRESQLLQQILAPALRSRNPDRRREAVDALESLAAIATQLKHLLLVRDLRRVIG